MSVLNHRLFDKLLPLCVDSLLIGDAEHLEYLIKIEGA
jgi:hypothetical protein